MTGAMIRTSEREHQRIPVLLMVPGTDSLRKSALAFEMGRPEQTRYSELKLPKQFSLDTAFPAIAVGIGYGAVSLESRMPDKSELFLVRAYADVDDPKEVPETIGGRLVIADPPIETFQPTCGGSPALGNSAAVRAQLNVPGLVAKGLDGTGTAIAIVDTGINTSHLNVKVGYAVKLDAANSWKPAGHGAPPGSGAVGHGTMCAYDVLLAAPKATLLDVPILSVPSSGGSAMSGHLSTAILAYAHLIGSWGVGYAAGSLGASYKALIVNNSWGMFHPSWDLPAGHPGRFCDNPSHPFHSIVGTLVRTGADVLFAAGNCGSACPDRRCVGSTTGSIMGSSAYPEVLTVAGCDLTDNRVGYSSQGPSMAGMFQDKPDLTTYTHFLGSEVDGAGSPDTGTSAACPVAAGCVAAIRTRLPHTTTPPANLISQLQATARPKGPAGWNGDYGYGLLDPVAAASSLGL